MEMVTVNVKDEMIAIAINATNDAKNIIYKDMDLTSLDSYSYNENVSDSLGKLFKKDKIKEFYNWSHFENSTLNELKKVNGQIVVSINMHKFIMHVKLSLVRQFDSYMPVRYNTEGNLLCCYDAKNGQWSITPLVLNEWKIEEFSEFQLKMDGYLKPSCIDYNCIRTDYKDFKTLLKNMLSIMDNDMIVNI